MLIKVCGMKLQNQAIELDQIIDFMGFIYYEKSARCILVSPVTENVKRVGVFVNESLKKMKEIGNRDTLDIIQLHGDENAEICRELRLDFKIIKAFGIDDSFEFSRLKEYEAHVDYFLFDTQSKQYGGTGIKFNWQLLDNYKMEKPFFLSGGICSDHISELKKITHQKLIGLDLNSGFEISPANKNCKQIKNFIDEINS